MRSFTELWPTLKRLLAYGSPWRKPLAIAVAMMWIAAAAEVSGPLLISYFIDNMVAKHTLPLKLVAGLAVAYIGLQLLAALLLRRDALQFFFRVGLGDGQAAQMVPPLGDAQGHALAKMLVEKLGKGRGVLHRLGE